MIELTVKMTRAELVAEIVDNAAGCDIVSFVSDLADRAFFDNDDIRQQIINRLKGEM